MYISFSFTFEQLPQYQSTLIYSEDQLCFDQPKSSACMLNCKKIIPDTTIMPLRIQCNVASGMKQQHTNYLSEFISSFPRNHAKHFVGRHQQAHQSIQPVNEINNEVVCKHRWPTGVTVRVLDS